LEHGDYSISTIEETEDADREGYWIRGLGACNQMTLDFDMAAYLKEYNKVNKDTIREKQREKIACLKCGAVIRRDSMPRHKRSQRCKDSSA